jgi:hypothetical protein
MNALRGSSSRQPFGPDTVDLPEFAERIGSVVGHDMDPRCQVNDCTHTL